MSNIIEDGFDEGAFFTTILWGEDDGLNNQVTKTYKFDSEDKLHAFLWGVDASSGWMEYEVKEVSGEE